VGGMFQRAVVISEWSEMPMKSKAQNRAMHAAAEGKSNIGIPKKVAKKFVKDSHGQKVKKLPEKKKRK
jgi:hypothetical protein